MGFVTPGFSLKLATPVNNQKEMVVKYWKLLSQADQTFWFYDPQYMLEQLRRYTGLQFQVNVSMNF